jgi:DNA-binding MarR family transcriptional regulator
MVAEHHPGELIRKVHLRLRRLCDAELSRHGLTFSQFVVLSAVAEHPDASLAELADRTGMSRQAAHQALRRLHAAALVAVADSGQGLDQSIELTAAGQLVMVTAIAVVCRAEEHMVAGIAADDRDRLAILLGHCIENLQIPLPPSPTA